MKRHLHCAEQQVSRSNLTKYRLPRKMMILVTYETSFTMRGATSVTLHPHQICACHAKWRSKISAKTGETSFTLRGRSENDPRMIRPSVPECDMQDNCQTSKTRRSRRRHNETRHSHNRILDMTQAPKPSDVWRVLQQQMLPWKLLGTNTSAITSPIKSTKKRQRIQSNALEGVIHVNVHLNLKIPQDVRFALVPKARRWCEIRKTRKKTNVFSQMHIEKNELCIASRFVWQPERERRRDSIIEQILYKLLSGFFFKDSASPHTISRVVYCHRPLPDCIP